MFTTTDFTSLHQHLKHWWVKRFPVILSALGVGLGVFFALGLLDILAVLAFGPIALWGLLLAVVGAGVAYGVWGYARPGYMRASAWLSALVDYARQPRRFVGLSPDREPVRLHWTVIVYDIGGRTC